MIQDSRKLLRALDNLTNETIHAEQYFTDELHLFFQYLCRKLLKELDLKNPLDSLFHLEPNNIIEKYWKEYDKIFSYYVDVGATIGNIHYEVLLNASKAHAKEFASTKSRETVQSLLDYKFNSEDTDTLFKPDPKVSSRLKRYKFEASERTKARVTEDINNILGEAYREGWGPRHVGEKIQERFNQLSGYEARRIAQTELNTTRNMVQYNRLKDDEMPYKIWHSAHDARTRKSHLDVDEEIVPIDEKFSNGLMYPGDKSGPIREWVNCRCSHAAFVMPLGYEAPSFFPFRESDLVKVGSSVSSSYIPELRERLGLVEGIVQGAVTERQRQKVSEETKPKTNGDTLWEDLAEKHGLELVGYDGSMLEFHDPTHKTSLKFHTLANKEWIDYTNRGKKHINIESFLEEYTAMPSLHKNAAPDIHIQGEGQATGFYEMTRDSERISLFKDSYVYTKEIPDSGDVGLTLRHECSHAIDSKYIYDRNLAMMSKSSFWFSGNHKELDNGAYKKAVAKDRRNRKKTGGYNYVSEYARTSGLISEDFAEALALRSYRDAPEALRKKACLWERRDGKLVKVTYDEFEKRYPNRCKVLDEILDNYTLGW